MKVTFKTKEAYLNVLHSPNLSRKRGCSFQYPKLNVLHSPNVLLECFTFTQSQIAEQTKRKEQDNLNNFSFNLTSSQGLLIETHTIETTKG